MGKISGKEYWGMVADDAVKRAKGAERLRAILFGVATIIFVGICLFSYQQVGEITPQNLRENVGFAVIQFAAESFLLIVVVFIAIGAFIFNVPPELHNTKLTEINALKDKYERPPLPFFLEITEEKEPIDRPRVGIRIYNPRPNAIEHLVVRLVELRLLKNDEKWESISLVGNLGLPKVMYTHGEGDIRGFDHAIVYIANAGEEEITFLTGDEFYRAYWTNENDNMLNPAFGESTYLAKVLVGGETNGFVIRKKLFTLKIHFHIKGRHQDATLEVLPDA
jgi:hypothetical protein